MIIPITNVDCEPQLSKRGMYSTISRKNIKKSSKVLLSFLQYSDGKNDLKKICKYLKINMTLAKNIYKKLKLKKLLK